MSTERNIVISFAAINQALNKIIRLQLIRYLMRVIRLSYPRSVRIANKYPFACMLFNADFDQINTLILTCCS